MVIDFNKLPFVQAKWYTPADGRVRRKIVIHSMEAPEKGTTAESVARYFQTLPATRKASAHYCIDTDSIVQCVQTKDVAYAAPGANHDGVHLELAGYARQTAADWHDPASRAILSNAAALCGKILVPKLGIPVVFLTAENLIRTPSLAGFTTHAVISTAFKRSSHWDPGAGFPMNEFLEEVRSYLV